MSWPRPSNKETRERQDAETGKNRRIGCSGRAHQSRPHGNSAPVPGHYASMCSSGHRPIVMSMRPGDCPLAWTTKQCIGGHGGSQQWAAATLPRCPVPPTQGVPTAASDVFRCVSTFMPTKPRPCHPQIYAHAMCKASRALVSRGDNLLDACCDSTSSLTHT